MPSARPKLVEIGVPITGGSTDNDDDDDDDQDHDMGGSSSNNKNRFVIGGTTTSTTAPASSLSAASHTVIGGGDHSMMDASHGSKSTQKRSSLSTSLARASKGTLIGDHHKKTTPRISHSYVVGGGGTPVATTHTNLHALQDEPSFADAPMEGTSSSSSPTQHSKPRTSLTATSFQIPGNNPHHNPHSHDDTSQSHDGMDLDPAPPPTATKFVVHPASHSHPTSFVIGGASLPLPPPPTQTPVPLQHFDNDNDEVVKMEGVIDLSEKPPMVVLDGANLAYAYDKAWQGGSSLAASQQRPVPDARGIVVACQYFLAAGIRVLAVVPATMMHRDPHQTILQPLEQQGVVVPAPSRDDDDAYAITIARREDAKARQRGDGPGYVMSNDQFRDAMRREESEDDAHPPGHSSPAATSSGYLSLRTWLTEGSVRDNGTTGPGRISFTFCDTGSMDDHGDRILDIVPNPRHPLVQFIEKQQH